MIRENVYDNFDEFYRDLVNYIASDKGVDIKENVRTVYADGTPAYYRQVIGLQVRFKPYKDSKGNYRALLPTTRYAPYKSAIKELEWVWSLQSNDVNVLERELGCKYWSEWSIKETNNKEIIYIKSRKKKKYDESKINRNVKIQDLKFTNYDKIYDSINFGKYIVLNWENNYTRANIQFLNTGSIKNVSNSQVYQGEVKDNYVRVVNNLGYYGNYKNEDIVEYFGKYLRMWIVKWENMIRRCTGKYSGGSSWYNEIFVSEEFHCCETFLRWVMENNRYGKEFLPILQIDKDYYNSNCYSKDTCVLLTPKENTALTLKEFYYYDKIYFFSKSDFKIYVEKKFNIELSKQNTDFIDKFIEMFKCNRISKNLVKIIKNEYDYNKGGFPRFSLDINKNIKKGYGYQLAKPLYNYNSQVDYIIGEIKNNPNSRRIITELWNVDDLEDMTLTPCLHLTQWTVEKGKLILSIRQRSCDTALGLISNIWQYQVLQHLIAKECNLEVGDLIWTVDNLHIYDRHIDKLGEQVMRKFYNPPTFKINNFNGFYGFEWNDIELLDYKYGDKIKYEVAI